MLFRTFRPASPRRGVTLVEMLVSVALLVLMMTVIVQVFAAATGAVTASRTFQELDGTLRQIDGVLRTDLQNVTAKLTPPLNPRDNLGYFEYGENSFADLQGEDCDDYLRFTAKAPEGQLFTGRAYVAPTNGLSMGTSGNMTAAQLSRYYNSQPVTVSSQYAEIIYFLRNGNLYRRVLLVAPERQSSMSNSYVNATTSAGVYFPGIFGGTQRTSWQGVNDFSARPISTGTINSSAGDPLIILNTLADLTNRENRFAYSRFSDDFYDQASNANGYDFRPDDRNFDTVPDYYPSLYYGVWSANLLNEPAPRGAALRPQSSSADTMAFPYTFPGAYSVPDNSGGTLANGYGWIHTPDPSIDQTVLADLKNLNHNPLEYGDSLPRPPAGSLTRNGGLQTWWGFPTWRETLAPLWNDPYRPVHLFGGQPNGLHPPTDTTMGTSSIPAGNGLPPMTAAFRLVPQLFNDSTPSTTPFAPGSASPAGLWNQTWEDDLIATGVRSFDVKAYDNSYGGYVDLGWGDDLRDPKGSGTYLSATPAFTVTGTGTYDTVAQTYAHEGRMPPLVKDNRLDAQFPYIAGSPYNIGDSTNLGTVRLRRVWDSWSTDYSNAPSTGVDSDPKSATYGQPYGPPRTYPVYPSYPAPYPMPLRGIQIQIRVVDPRNERVKVLTIRQDFSDKL